MLDSNARVRSFRGVRFATKCNTQFVESNLHSADWSRIPYKPQGQSHKAVRRKHPAQGWVACGGNTRDAMGSLCRNSTTCVSVLGSARGGRVLGVLERQEIGFEEVVNQYCVWM
jgi:hypothetical protein